MKISIKTLFATVIVISCQLITVNCLGQANESGSGNALDFDGVDDYVTTFNFGNQLDNAATWECWVYVDNLANNEIYLLNASTSSNWGSFSISIRNNYACSGGSIHSFAFTWHTDADRKRARSNATVNTNTWYHITGVWDGSNVQIYVNGLPGNNAALSGTTTSPSTPVRFGMRNDGLSVTAHDGKIDEFRIWNRALTQTEIQANMCRKLPDCADPDLVGYWRFDEGVDNTCLRRAGRV